MYIKQVHKKNKAVWAVEALAFDVNTEEAEAEMTTSVSSRPPWLQSEF